MKRFAAGLCLLLLLVACASKPPAPVDERSSRPDGNGAPDGYYRVLSGDTLYAIAFGHGLDYRRLAEWNALRAPYMIFPGQELRLTPPTGVASRSSSRQQAVRTTPRPAPQARTVEAKPSPPPKPATASTSSTTAQAAPSTPKPAPVTSSPPTRWLWPATGRIIRGWSPTDPSRDGIDIAGREGDDVKASADGTIVYSGNGLIGYGELIIVKHDERWLSAYGHNRKRLVSEGDVVKAGQKIAEIGRNDRNEQVLHFEIRSNGRPVNPLDHLPAR